MIAEQYAAVGVYLEEADDDRINGAGFRGDPLDPLSLRETTNFSRGRLDPKSDAPVRGHAAQKVAIAHCVGGAFHFQASQ